MDLDSPSPLPTPTAPSLASTPGLLTPSTLARKRTFNDLADATHSLALVTPDPMLVSDGSYFPRAPSPPKRARTLPAPGTLASDPSECPAFDALGMLRGFVRVDGRGPTKNWARMGWGSAVLVYVPPRGVMGDWWEVVCAVLERLERVAGDLQGVALSETLDATDAGVVHPLLEIMPVRRAPSRVEQILVAGTAITGVGLGDARWASGCVVLVDSAGKVRLALPLGYVEAMARDLDDGFTILEETLRKALDHLELEKRLAR